MWAIAIIVVLVVLAKSHKPKQSRGGFNRNAWTAGDTTKPVIKGEPEVNPSYSSAPPPFNLWRMR